MARRLRPARGRRHGWRGRLLRRPSPRALVILVGLLAVLGGGWLWFRDSSLVSVDRVRVTGLSGPSVARIRTALINSAMKMSTLDVDVAKLRATVRAFPDVRAITVSSQFPHGLVIHVDEEIPVAALSIGGRRYAVDSRGTLLRAPVRSDGRLPTIPAGPTDGQGARLADTGERAALRVLGAAPFALLAHIAAAGYTGAHGVLIRLRNGPELRFGTRADLRAKWAAAMAVLADPSAAGAQYIDVSNPARPAAGVNASTAATVTTGTASTPPTGQASASTSG